MQPDLVGDLDSAESALRSAIRFEPENPGPYNTLGQVLRLKGDRRGAPGGAARRLAGRATEGCQLAKMLRKE